MIAIMPTLYLVMLIVWGAIFLLSLIVEVSTDGLVSIWFTVGAFVALILALFPQIPFWVPIIAFAVTSLIVFLLFFFFWRDKIRGVKKARLNANAAVGKTFVLLEAIDENHPGLLRNHGVTWECVSENDKPIAKGAKVEIVNLVGNRYVVKIHS